MHCFRAWRFEFSNWNTKLKISMFSMRDALVGHRDDFKVPQFALQEKYLQSFYVDKICNSISNTVPTYLKELNTSTCNTCNTSCSRYKQ